MYINDRMIKPVIIGGVITGISMFIISYTYIAGCCCSFLYILSGVITTHLLTQEYPPSDKDYLIAGALSGCVTGFVKWLLVTLVAILYIFLYGTMFLPYMGVVRDHYTSASYTGASTVDFIIFAFILLMDFVISLLLGVVLGIIGMILYRVLVEEIMKG